MITRGILSYLPELNPCEVVCGAMKYQELLNFCSKRNDDLYSEAEMTPPKMRADQEKLRRIIVGTKLPTAFNTEDLIRKRGMGQSILLR
ncbi:MAG: hypothetical protein QXW75_02815 [Thermoplasmatales archaeon]